MSSTQTAGCQECSRSMKTNQTCPNCRGQGTIIAMWDYIGCEHITQPGAPNLWPDPRHPRTNHLIRHGQSGQEHNAESINHGRSDSEQSDPEQQIEPDPRPALQGAVSPEPTNRGRRSGPTLHRLGTPEHSHTESAWGTRLPEFKEWSPTSTLLLLCISKITISKCPSTTEGS